MTVSTLITAQAVTHVDTTPPAPFGTLPTQRQADHAKLETYGFLHFTVNTFTDREWGLGSEDEKIVTPAIEILRAEGIQITGPLPADTMFHDAARKTYDCAICMYHDQALIPVKTLAFDDAVNVTLGLPFVRTSPDHGTAFDIAGTGRANPSSLIAALRLAARLAAAPPA